MEKFVKGILVVLVTLLAGCAKEESLENETLESFSLSFVREAIANASEKNFEIQDLPEWLIEYVFHLDPNSEGIVSVFQTKWKGEVVYYISYIYDAYSSRMLCSIFMSNGEKFDGPKYNLIEFWNSSPNWELIYLSKNKIHDL